MELHGRLRCMVGAVHAGGGWGRVVVTAAAGWGSDVGLGTASPVLVAGVVVVGVVVAWRGRHLVTIPGRPMSGHGGVSAAGVVEPSGAVAEKPSKSSHQNISSIVRNKIIPKAHECTKFHNKCLHLV